MPAIDAASHGGVVLLLLGGRTAALPAAAETINILVQSSPLAGSQYDLLAAIRPALKLDDIQF